MATQEEVKTRMLACLEIDESDYTEEGTIAEFFNDEELEEAKEKLGDEFDINVESMNEETTLSEMVEVLTAHINAQ